MEHTSSLSTPSLEVGPTPSRPWQEIAFHTMMIGNSTWAGATAAFMANMVLIAYVIVAMREDEGEKLAAEDKARKGE